MSEPLKNELGDVLGCEFCGTGAATRTFDVPDHERQFGRQGISEYRLCDLCAGGSVSAHSFLVRGELGHDGRLEMVVARMLNVFRGSVGD